MMEHSSILLVQVIADEKKIMIITRTDLNMSTQNLYNNPK